MCDQMQRHWPEGTRSQTSSATCSRATRPVQESLPQLVVPLSPKIELVVERTVFTGLFSLGPVHSNKPFGELLKANNNQVSVSSINYTSGSCRLSGSALAEHACREAAALIVA